MSNIFLQNKNYTPPVKRNPYDKQRLNNGTWKSGFIYPVGWDEILFGGSVRVNLAAGIRTLPMVFPIQTPIHAKFYTFYVRYRTLMKDFTDFRFGNKEITHPYIAVPASSDFWKTGNLADHMGIPTTFGSNHAYQRMSISLPEFAPPTKNIPLFYRTSLPILSTLEESVSFEKSLLYNKGCRFISPKLNNFSSSSSLLVRKDLFVDSPSSVVLSVFARVVTAGVVKYTHMAYQVFQVHDVLGNFYIFDISSGNYTDLAGSHSGGLKTYFSGLNTEVDVNHIDYYYMISDYDAESLSLDDSNISYDDAIDYVRYDIGEGVVELQDVSNPFSGNAPAEPLTSLPLRAYEAIYRSYFQDMINEPFIIDGEPQYNRYITNDGNGPDTVDYHLFRRNWEADRFTSCKPSPQQGLAPIVGVTSSGDITLERIDGEHVTYRLTENKDGVIDGWQERVEGQKSDNTVRRRLLDLATTGFTINSLRDVNSFQRWKEATYRNSLKFRDQVASVFGVKLEYKELDMPEFLGGFDIPLSVNEIAQTSSSVQGSPLGDLAGRGMLAGRANHSISHFCDEEGIIMTVMCITPIPVYSQMLDRKWLKSNPLDYFNPQFGKIGNQAVTYEEVAPVQAYNEGIDLHDVFGYQMPWYHYTSAFDEVHGLFRTSMNGFVMQRVFGSTPELGADFIHIKDEDLNAVFVTMPGQTDPFYGQVNMDVKIKHPIPRKYVAGLE